MPVKSLTVMGNEALLEGVASQLASVTHFGGFSYISIPLLFPSGGTVAVRVCPSFKGFVVTDHGIGADEADLLDGKHFYSQIAPKVAESAGIRFDQHSAFVLQAKEDQLAGAVTVVANCVHEAVAKTSYKLEESPPHD